MAEQPTWDKLARQVIKELEQIDDEKKQMSLYSYSFTTPESVQALAKAIERANKRFMWTPIQEVKSAGRASS